MSDDDLTDAELATLARFAGPEQPEDVDPQHFAALLALALLEQKEGGPVLTRSGRERLAAWNGAR
ncbi:hypothetical protein [Devosia chinhatensis]|uniref:Uncharacterized protein n=1 Tax=Devosia chinhatensis TaxID=429727 RepID=A0A0F5FGJ8_9HYPH|nr:hypothetical protein [Devosia chinhatensis]KKB07981.1 hypothetical protein VE26_15400 [Devosia chinhatensis]